MPLVLETIRYCYPRIPLFSPKYDEFSTKYLFSPKIYYLVPKIPSSRKIMTFLPENSNFLPKILFFLAKNTTFPSKIRCFVKQNATSLSTIRYFHPKMLPFLLTIRQVLPNLLFSIQNRTSSPLRWHFSPQNMTFLHRIRHFYTTCDLFSKITDIFSAKCHFSSQKIWFSPTKEHVSHQKKNRNEKISPQNMIALLQNATFLQKIRHFLLHHTTIRIFSWKEKIYSC